MDFERSRNRVCVSQCSKYIASCGADETVRVWQSNSGKQLHQLQLPKQLSSPVSSMLFAAKHQNKACGTVLALGTASGRVILYDWSAAAVIRDVTTEGGAAVSDLSWYDHTTLAILTTDYAIIFWNIVTGRKERESRVRGRQSVCVLEESSVAVASQSIEVVSAANTSTVLQNFTGHATPTTTLVKHDQYLISASTSDTFVYVWKLQSEVPPSRVSESPWCSVVAVEGVVCVAAATDVLAVVSVNGVIRLYNTNRYRSRKSKPLKEKGSLTLYSDAQEKHVLPIVQVFDVTSTDFGIMYGEGSCLFFERMKLAAVTGGVKLVRTFNNRKVDHNKVHLLPSDVTHKKVTYATPAHMPDIKSCRGKRSAGEEEPSSLLPMESRLSAITSTASVTATKNSQAHLLIQGLESNDSKLLARVLHNGNEEVIRRTVSSLPITAIVPLIKHFHSILNTLWHKHSSYIMWVQEIFYQQNSFLCSLPRTDYAALTRPFVQYSQAKAANLPILMELKSRLEQIKFRVSQQNKQQAAGAEAYPPLIEIKDYDSEDEGLDMGDDLTNGCESDSAMEDCIGEEFERAVEKGDDVDEEEDSDEGSEDEEEEDSNMEYDSADH